ncbi:MAG: hypothetical protein E7022_03025 [Desulfovibrio desulfuricans]|nr:hypothetical protein [Desulfovibrio desulfuricans]
MAWFRWHEGTATDPKFHVVARKSGQPVAFVVAVWAMLLERASAAKERGHIEGFDCESADVMLGMPDGAACAIVEAMQAKGLIDDECVCKWNERQPKREDESAAERKRESRARKRTEESECHVVSRNVTHGHDDTENVTHGHARVDKSREEINTGGEGVICAPARVAGSVPENPAEDTPAVPATPKRTDCPSKGHPQWRAFLSCWDVYPVQQRQEEAWREWMRLYENHTLAEPYVIRDAILLLSQEDSRWRRGKVRDMSKWLNGKGWNDKPFCEPSAAVPVAPAGGGQTRAPTEHQRRQQESRNMAAALLAAREQERQQHMGGGHAGQTAIGDAAR